MIEKVVSSMSSGMSRATCCATWESQMTRRGLDFRLFNTRLTSRSFATTATASERRSFPLGALRKRLGELPQDRDRETVCSCKISLKGYEAALVLEANGWKKVTVMKGASLPGLTPGRNSPLSGAGVLWKSTYPLPSPFLDSRRGDRG